MFLGAASVLSNGAVLSRVGTAAVALMAAAQRVPGELLEGRRAGLGVRLGGSFRYRKGCHLRYSSWLAASFRCVRAPTPAGLCTLSSDLAASSWVPAAFDCKLGLFATLGWPRSHTHTPPHPPHASIPAPHPHPTHPSRSAVLVCCESYKFHERVQLDSITHNELLDQRLLATVRQAPCSFPLLDRGGHICCFFPQFTRIRASICALQPQPLWLLQAEPLAAL